MYEELILTGFDNTPIFTISKTDPDDRATLLIMHGLHDHCGRYAHLADYFGERGFSTVRYDMRGFGRSGGLRGYIESFEDYIQDFHSVEDRYIKGSDKPCFLFAHSISALISSMHFLQDENLFTGVVFSGGLFKVNEDLSPLLQKMSGLISWLFPKLPTMKIDKTGLSRDPEVGIRIANDPLHYMGGIRARTGSQLMKATAALQGRLQELNFPMLILHGGADPLTKPEASELLYSKSMSADKTLKIYPNAFHELINEINKEEVLDDIHTWIVDRIPE